eukprot:scaffold122950_cov31-Tisochrysis_lutea.AAC.4
MANAHALRAAEAVRLQEESPSAPIKMGGYVVMIDEGPNVLLLLQMCPYVGVKRQSRRFIPMRLDHGPQ